MTHLYRGAVTPWVRFRVARLGGIQPARVMRATNTAREGMSATTTSGIGAERRTAFPSHAQEVCEARIDTPYCRVLSSLAGQVRASGSGSWYCAHTTWVSVYPERLACSAPRSLP